MVVTSPRPGPGNLKTLVNSERTAAWQCCSSTSHREPNLSESLSKPRSRVTSHVTRDKSLTPCRPGRPGPAGAICHLKMSDVDTAEKAKEFGNAAYKAGDFKVIFIHKINFTSPFVWFILLCAVFSLTLICRFAASNCLLFSRN